MEALGPSPSTPVTLGWRALTSWLLAPLVPQIPLAPCRGSQRLGYPAGTHSASGSWSCSILALNMGTLFSLAEAFKPSQDPPKCLETGGHLFEAPTLPNTAVVCS